MEQQEKGRREDARESDAANPYDEKMKMPQMYYFRNQLEAFKEFFRNDPKALLEPFDLQGNTAIHIATKSDNPQLLRELLERVPQLDRRRALRILNAHGATVMHSLVSCSHVEMVDLLLSYDAEIEPEEGPLLELKNDIGETPFYRAAKRGNLKLLKKMVNHVTDMEKHFNRDSDDTSILHIAIIGQYFGESITLLISLFFGCIENLIHNTILIVLN